MGLPGVWNIGEEQIGLSMQVTETTCVSGEFYACFHADTLDRWIKNMLAHPELPIHRHDTRRVVHFCPVRRDTFTPPFTGFYECGFK